MPSATGPGRGSYEGNRVTSKSAVGLRSNSPHRSAGALWNHLRHSRRQTARQKGRSIVELDRPAALAALRQLLECCKSAETVVDYAGRSYTVKVSPVDFRDAQIKALSRYARYAEPLSKATSALHAAGFNRPYPLTPAVDGKPEPTTEFWLAQGDNAWAIVNHLAPIVQVNNDQRAPDTIWESWPSLEAIRLLSNKIRQTIGELEQQCRCSPWRPKRTPQRPRRNHRTSEANGFTTR